MKASSILALFLGWQVAFAASAATLRASDVLMEIEQRGARTAIRAFFENTEQWRKLLEGVSSGSPEWLMVAEKLSPVADAGAGEMLDIALFHALGSEPLPTLKLISRIRSVDTTCSSNFLTDTVADQNALSMIDKRIGALKAIQDPALVTTRDLCIQGLEQARLDVLRIMAETKEKPESK